MLTQEQVRKLFNYNSETGVLTWKIRPANNVQIGDTAGSDNGEEYLQTKINRRLHYNHRISYLWYHGYLPEFIDHKNGMSNKIDNLRECTQSQNQCNRKLNRNNTSGIKGVSWNKLAKKWVAKVYIDGKQKHLGFFTGLSDAESAVKAARKKHHGEFVNHG
jgi:hypothetical protein